MRSTRRLATSAFRVRRSSFCSATLSEFQATLPASRGHLGQLDRQRRVGGEHRVGRIGLLVEELQPVLGHPVHADAGGGRRHDTEQRQLLEQIVGADERIEFAVDGEARRHVRREGAARGVAPRRSGTRGRAIAGRRGCRRTPSGRPGPPATARNGRRPGGRTARSTWWWRRRRPAGAGCRRPPTPSAPPRARAARRP